MAKTPFEIRTELLNLAYSLCSDRMYAERTRLENDWNVNRDKWRDERGHAGARIDPPPFPQMPTLITEEIIEEAKKMNEFVSNGS